jgi:U3 small nucleolar ribonucleoprotein protein IMP3
MVRKLKFHEQKLLRKVDLYRDERNVRVAEVLRKYHIGRREDYTK